MDTIDPAHAKAHLEDIIARATKGEEFHIGDAKLGTVKVVAIEPPKSTRPKRVIGERKDEFEVPARLFEPLT